MKSRLLPDLGLYLAFAVYAKATAQWSEFHGFQVWGNFAFVAYVLASVHALLLLLASHRLPLWLRSRTLPIWLVAAVGLVLPLAYLVLTRVGVEDFSNTPWTWSAQPNVWVIERSASLLLANGTPYVDIFALGREPNVNDYTPYGPLMPLFGLPKALFGVDARIVFVLVALGAVLLSLHLLKWPRIPVRVLQLISNPLALLTMTTAGEDLAVLALLGLTATLILVERPGWAAFLAAVVVSIKLIALPAVVVLIVFMLRRYMVFLGSLALLNLPILLVNPGAFVEHAIRFPTGTAQVTSPAASPFPGHLLTTLGPWGHTLALALLVAAGCAIGWWLLRRPPQTVSDAFFRVVIGMGAAILLMPASRFGYLVYPLAFAGLMLFFGSLRRTPTFQLVGASGNRQP